MSGVSPHWPREDAKQCCAPIGQHCLSNLQRRASGSDSHRCQRHAHFKIEGKWFCYAHAPMWQQHYRIVQKIRDILPR